MKSNTRFEVVSMRLSILLFLSSSVASSSEDGSSDPQDSSRAARKAKETAALLCGTTYSERNEQNPVLEVKQVPTEDRGLECHSTQPINWIFRRNPQGSNWNERDQENNLPFLISINVVPCGSWKTPIVANFSMAAPAANSNSKIGYYFTSWLTIWKRSSSKSYPSEVVDIFCATFTPTKKSESAIFPRVRIELWKNGDFGFINKTETLVPETSRECDDLILAHDSTGQCACESTDGTFFSPFFTICSDLMRCRVWAESRPKSYCEAKTVDNRCSISSFILPQYNHKGQGGILYCRSTKQWGSPFTTFLSIPQSNLSKGGKSESNLTEIQILGNFTENYGQFLTLEIFCPTKEKEITRKTGALIHCRGPAFLFLQGLFWTVESKDKETEPNFLPNFEILAPKPETSSDFGHAGHVSSTLRILPDNQNQNTSAAVNVKCEAFVKDKPFLVQSNLTLNLAVYKPKIKTDVECVAGVALNYFCTWEEADDVFSVTWHPLDQHLQVNKKDLKKIALTKCGENLTCTATLPNGVSNFHTLTKENCESLAKEHNCTAVLDKSKTTEKSESTLETTTATIETSTVSASSSRTVATDSTVILTTTTTSSFSSTSTSIPMTTTMTTQTTTAETSTVDKNSQTQSRNNQSSSSGRKAENAEEAKGLKVEIVIIAVSGVLGLCLLIFVPFVIILMRKNRKQREKLKMSDEDVNDFLQGNDSVHFIPYDTRMEIPKDKITIGTKVLGSGAFGKVVEGQFGEKRVAIKTVNKSADMQYFKALLSEIKIMGFVGKHENVLELLGACTWDIKKRNVYVVFELCENGNLVQYLRKNRGNFESLFQKHDEQLIVASRKSIGQRLSMMMPTSTPLTNPKMTTRDLVRWSLEIACGMDVIAQKNIYHGDLAARNILLDKNLVAKVGDFGLSRQLCDYSVYVQKMSCPLPLKWMSIESLRDLEFSIQSDVWSFGITLWEIFSLGCQPYPNAEWNFASWKNLLEGERMEKPEHASNSIYEIMLKCWSEKPTDRPTFAQLKTMFEDERQKLQHNLE